MNPSLKTILFLVSICILTRPVTSLENNSSDKIETKDAPLSEKKNDNEKKADAGKEIPAQNQKDTPKADDKSQSQFSNKQSENEITRKNKQNNNGLSGKKSGKTIDPNAEILKNPSLSEEFRESYIESNPIEHTLINFFYGVVSGGIIGLGGGLSFYTASTVLTPLYITAGAVGAAGGITGIVIALIETANKKEFQISAGLFEYTWYGVFGGALLGGLVGLIPYSTTNNLASLLNWVGYGTFAGLGAGIAIYFIFPRQTMKNWIIDTNPQSPKIGYRFYF